jgi:formylmethanofuran dehydrogenase subunit E
MNNLTPLLEKVRTFHGELCAGAALGTRISITALRILELDPLKPGRNLIVFPEIDRCMTDAIQAITDCSLGRRTLKFIDHGKFGATFYNMATEKAVRVASIVNPRDLLAEKGMEAAARILLDMPEQELLNVRMVKIDLPATERPGKAKQGAQFLCAECGEYIFDGREIIMDNLPLCKGCAQGYYYLPLQNYK